MVDKVQKILPAIEREKGLVSLFAILKMDDYADRWSILLCAPWISESNRRDIFSFVLTLLKKELSPDDLAAIIRIGVFSSDYHLAQLITERYKEGAVIRESERINGNMIYEAHIFASRSQAELS